jgi:hypothetical protein
VVDELVFTYKNGLDLQRSEIKRGAMLKSRKVFFKEGAFLRDKSKAYRRSLSASD